MSASRGGRKVGLGGDDDVDEPYLPGRGRGKRSSAKVCSPTLVAFLFLFFAISIRVLCQFLIVGVLFDCVRRPS